MSDTLTDPNPARPAEPVTRVFTFGYGHVDPNTGQSLAESCAVIIAATAERCREIMLARWGQRWAFEYATVEKAAGRSGRMRVHQTIDDTARPVTA